MRLVTTLLRRNQGHLWRHSERLRGSQCHMGGVF